MRETRRLPLNLLIALFVASALLSLTSPLAAGFCNNPFPPGAAPPAGGPGCSGGGSRCGGGGPPAGGSGGGGGGGGAGAGTHRDKPGPPSPNPAPGPPSPPSPPGTVCCDFCTGSPCYVASGVYETRATDLELPTPGFPLVASRTYQSSHAIDGPTGYGWTSNLAARLFYTTYLFAAPSTYQKEADITMPGGARLRFVDNGNGTFTPPANRYDTLVMNGDGTWDLTLMWSLSVLHFNADGSLASQRDDYGNTLSYSYDGNGRLQQVTDASGSGRFFNVFWGADGRISSVLDSAGRQIGYSYDTRGVMTSESDLLARLTHYTYAQGRFAPLLAAITDNWNRVVSTITYDAADRTQSYTENGETYTYTYKYQGDPTETAKADSLGNTWVYRYGPTGPISDAIPPVGAGGGTVHQDYYGDMSLQQRIDAVGVKTYYSYDTQGQIVSFTGDYQGTSSVRFDRTYDPHFPARLTSEIAHNPSTGAVDPNWQSRRYDYYQAGDPAPGALHHMYRVESDGGTLDTMATYVYDSQGRLTSKTDADGVVISYTYDSQGNLASQTQPPNNDAGTPSVSSYVYDAAGRCLTVTDPMAAVWSNTYDALGRELTTTRPAPAPGSSLDFTTHYSYDNYDAATGLVFTRRTDPNGNTRAEGFDAFGRLVEVIDPVGATTTYSYSHDLLVSQTDANGNVTRYSYDALKRLVSVTFPDGASETYTYFADGSRKSKTDRTNHTINYAYDAYKRLATKTYPSGAVISYTYQGNKLTQVHDNSASPSETHSLTYDPSYRVQSDTQGPRGTVTFTYTPADRRASYAVAGGASATYSFYASGALDTIQWSPVPGAFKFTYDLNGREQQITFPNAQQRNYTYDAQERPAQVANIHPTIGNLATFLYGYDVDNTTGAAGMLGRRTSITATVPSQGLAGVTTKYYYDQKYELTGADYPPVPPFNGEVDRWTYDKLNDRLTAAVNGVVATYSYAHNGTNPLNGQRLMGDGVNTYNYDANGSLVTKVAPGGQVTATWDAEGRLLGLAGTTSVSYAYDYRGRRVSKSGGAGATYLYVDSEIVSRTPGEDYLHGPGADEVLAVATSGGNVGYYAVDAMGSVSLVTDSAGNLRNTYSTDAWGLMRATSVSAPNAYGYVGRELNDDGTYYYRARYYDPSIGRFTAEDPSTYVGERYQYVSNNPISYSDPSGLGGGLGGFIGDCIHLFAAPFICPKFKNGFEECEGNPGCKGDPKVNRGEGAGCKNCLACCRSCFAYKMCESEGIVTNPMIEDWNNCITNCEETFECNYHNPLPPRPNMPKGTDGY